MIELHVCVNDATVGKSDYMTIIPKATLTVVPESNAILVGQHSQLTERMTRRGDLLK